MQTSTLVSKQISDLNLNYQKDLTEKEIFVAYYDSK